MKPTVRASAAALLLLCCLTATGQEAAPLEGEAWRHADRAYRAFEAQDHEQALREAEVAARLRPDLEQLRVLVEQAREALRTQRDRAARARAQPLAQRAYEDFAAGDFGSAARGMEQALAVHPAPLPWHALRIDALLALQDREAAAAALQAALRIHPDSRALQWVRAWAQPDPVAAQRLAPEVAGREPPAAAAMTTDEWRLATDLALAAGNTAAARRLAQGLRAQDPDGARQRELLASASWLHESGGAAAGLRVQPPAPRLECEASAGEEGDCRLAYAFEPLQALAQAAWDAAAAGNSAPWPQLLAAARLLEQWQPGHVGYRQLEVAALNALGEHEAAREAAREGLAHMDRALWQPPAAELAVLAHTAQDVPLEASAYDAAEAAGELRPGALQDAGYAAERVGDVAAAARRFRRALDAHGARQLDLSSQRQRDLRVAIGALERTWGASAGVFAGGGGTHVPGGLAIKDRSVQAAAEWFWRPRAARGYGTHLDLYLRGTGNLHSAAGERTGWSSLQPILGVRAKPLAQHNLVLAGERLFKAGAGTRDDWLLRGAYSWTQQMLGPAEAGQWRTSEFYGEAGRYLRAHESYLTAELRHGPQWRLARAADGDWGLWTHAVVAADYNNLYARPWAGSAGLGLGLRRWLRADGYHAGRSWVEWTLQYRAHLHGDRRNSGWVLRMNWNH